MTAAGIHPAARSIYVQQPYCFVGMTQCAFSPPPLPLNQFGDAERKHYIPEYIVGDLDSIRPEVAEYYRGRGATVRLIPDEAVPM